MRSRSSTSRGWSRKRASTLDLLFALRALVKALVLPPAGPLLVALAGLALLRRAPRTGRALAIGGTVVLLLLCLPVVAGLLARPFAIAPFDVSAAHDARAIVVLGGGLRRHAPEYGGETLGRLTAERVRYAARVARATGLPVLVSGGVPRGATRSEARAMREALEAEYGVPVRWMEEASRNTRENARYSAALLAAAGASPVILVAHAIDMPRARGEFADAGITTIAAPTGLVSRKAPRPGDFLPRASALQESHDALYELVANAARALGL